MICQGERHHGLRQDRNCTTAYKSSLLVFIAAPLQRSCHQGSLWGSSSVVLPGFARLKTQRVERCRVSDGVTYLRRTTMLMTSAG